MRLDQFIDGLRTLQPYYSDPDGFHTGAEHDQFYAYQTDKPLSPEDAAKMFALGWFQPEGEIKDGDHVNNYDPEDGWSAFT